MSKVIALVRVSTKAQEFESQSTAVRTAILQDGYTEEDIIQIEDKESGSKLSEEERSGLNKLKHAIESEQVSSVYVYEISRISRKEHILYNIREYLRLHQVQLVCLVPSFRMFNSDWSISDEAAFTFSIFSTLSSQETRVRTARMMRGKEKKKSEGKLSVGIVKFGYTLDKDHRPIPHPIYSKIVQEIFERYSNLESSGSIGYDLYLRKAIPTSSDKLITYQTYVASTLRDKRYGGLEEDSIYPPLVSKELFLKVQEIHLTKPEYFTRKSMTKEVYPLQGYIYTDDGYRLVPSISNNRYLKMRSNGTANPISLNMKAVHRLSTMILNRYISDTAIEVDRDKERLRLNEELERCKIKVNNINDRVIELEKENDSINRRLIKGRIRESLADDMIDSNVSEMRRLEDDKQELIYRISTIDNKLIYLSNPLFSSDSEKLISNDTELKEAVSKYLEKVTVKKIGFSKYTLTYHFKDHTTTQGSFYSTCKTLKFYDSEWNEIKK